MAEGIITVVVDHLLKMAETEIVSLMGLRKELDNLSSEFCAIKNVLQDAETRQISEESVRGWLQKLKYVAYDLDDMLEEWRILEVDAVTTPAGCTNCFGADQVRNFSSPLISLMKHAIRRLKYRKKVDEIKRRLQQIAAERNNYQFHDTPVREMRAGRRITDSWVDQPSVIGRDNDKKILISKLIEEDHELFCGGGKVPSLCIMGMGGLGKTTLAKSIYNTEMVKERFEERMWVCVGEVFNREEILKSMIESRGEVNHKQPISREQVAKMLGNKRYLLVLDDVWNEKYLEWEPLQEVLNQGAKGSRIVITTRNQGVAATVRAAHTHELKGLGDDECLSIFRKVVFGGESDQEYEHLMDIGVKIVRKCGGVPLAVKTIAGVIRGRQLTRREWEIIASSEIWNLPAGPEGILPALRLSYTDLPPRLKSCFGYCSLFEKDEELMKDELIRLWVSQGYVTLKNDERREVEEVGEEYFGELLGRSMFQDTRRDKEGTVISCKMHDLVHDLSRWVTIDECRVIGSVNDLNGNVLHPVHARHCAIKKEVVWRGMDNLACVGNLRTFVYSNHGLHDKPIDVVKKLQNVRVLNLRNCTSHTCFDYGHLRKLVHLRHLDLSGTGIEPPESIGALKEIRYLHLSGCTRITTLPKAIASLSNLRTLDLKGCRNLTTMPDEIPASLRHLDVEGCYNLRELPKRVVSLPHLQVINLGGCSHVQELPEGIPAMASLRRLNIKGCIALKKLPQGFGRRNEVVVRLDKFPVVGAGRDAGGGGCISSNIGELAGKNIGPPLGVRLAICNLEEVGSRDEARTAKLEEKTSLHALLLSWGRGSGTDRTRSHVTVVAGGVLEGLHPPSLLFELTVENYPGPTFPSWMGDGGALRHLQEVELESCENCTQLPPLGQLPSLHRLTIAGLPGLKRVGREFFGGPSPTFPCLTHLNFRDMRNWSEWVVIRPITTTSTSEEEEEGSELPPPVMPELQELELYSCPKLKVVPPIFTAAVSALHIRGISSRLAPPSRLWVPSHFVPISGTFVHIDSEVTELPAGLLRHPDLLQLMIHSLPNLKSLPEEVMQLTNLRLLDISDCVELSRERYLLIGGKLRPEIAHIPLVRIDGLEFRSGARARPSRTAPVGTRFF